MERDDFRPGVPSTGRPSDQGADRSSDRGVSRGADRGIDRNVDRIADRSEGSSGFADRARDIAGSTRDKLADVGSSARDKAGELKDSLADALDSGASKLRSRGSSSSSSYVGEGGSVVAEHDGRLADISNNVAGGLSSAASWLRSADIDNMKIGIEKQVREHPARTLLVAVGLGYLIGKAFRH